MAQTEPSGVAAPLQPPTVQTIGFADLGAALSAGWSDFREAPLFGLFFGAVYAIGGLAIVLFVTVLDWPYMVYPLAIGFPLIGPFVAVGLYEVSRRLEEGRPLAWGGVLGVVFAERRREMPWMAFVVLFVFWLWMYQVRLLLALFFGLKPIPTLAAFFELVFTTANGLTFLAVGHVVGGFLALVLFSVTVIACPLLLHKDYDFITAMITSVKTVVANPVPMIAWGAFVAVLLLLACVPAFLGLLVVLPVLGHATWHLYRRAVVPGERKAIA